VVWEFLGGSLERPGHDWNGKRWQFRRHYMR
jgi:hypothetical protein